MYHDHHLNKFIRLERDIYISKLKYINSCIDLYDLNVDRLHKIQYDGKNESTKTTHYRFRI